jgi:hypothetical protein
MLRRPSLDGYSVLWYNPLDVYEAFKLFLKASNKPELKYSLIFQ